LEETFFDQDSRVSVSAVYRGTQPNGYKLIQLRGNYEKQVRAAFGTSCVYFDHHCAKHDSTIRAAEDAAVAFLSDVLG
jgi:hypothetical protein